jgi:NAD+ synthase (glutamine-hydrolysing)
MAVVDVDVARVRQERMRTGSFGDSIAARQAETAFRVQTFAFNAPTAPLAIARTVDRYPFVPDDEDKLAEHCLEAYSVQLQGLAQRLKSTGLKRLVIGVSGGLDSTQALLVACRAMDLLGLPRTDILAFTMPGFATSDRTKDNAWTLMNTLGVTGAEPIMLAMCAALASSWGFMMPAGTGPNAIAWATGRIRIERVVVAGALLDIAGVFLIVGVVWGIAVFV